MSLILLLLKGYHTHECYNTTNNAEDDKDEYTESPVVKIVATLQKRTAASYQPDSIIPVSQTLLLLSIRKKMDLK